MNKKRSLLRKNWIAFCYAFKFCPSLLVFAIFYAIASVVRSLSSVHIISETLALISTGADIKILFRSLLIYIIIMIVCLFFITFYTGYITPRYRAIYEKKMQHFLFSKVKNIDMASYDDPAFYDRFSRALTESIWTGFRIYNIFLNFIISIASAIAVGTYIVILDPWLILLVIASSIINTFMIVHNNNLWYELFKKTEEERRYERYVNRTFYQQKYAGEIKTTSVSDLLIDKYNGAVNHLEGKYNQVYKKLVFPESIYLLSRNILNQAGSYIYLGYQLLKKHILIDTFGAMVSATIRFTGHFSSMVENFTGLQQQSRYVDDFLWIIDYKPQIEKNVGKIFEEEFQELKIEDILFRYPESDQYQLNHVSMTIHRGEKIAIVGHNGSGKTTLMKLLLRFYQLQSGDILMNQVSYQEYNERSLRKQFSIVFQDFQIYALTIAENVLMRKVLNKEDEARVLDALDKVGLKEKILSMPHGIYTQVTREFDRDGASFSGGERQRLVIARVFASDASIYILDEPTASLDPIAEERINRLVMQSTKDKTIIIIAHRLSTVVDADKIYLMKEGKIKEEGTHQELMKQNQDYAEMFLTQKRLYEKQESI